MNGYWPLVLFFIGAGALLFLLGTFEWLRARSRKEGVAVSWVYRISRHPQYLGWIVWSYGVYLLLLRAPYPKRSWGIGASLPWLLSTMVIIGVALVEELRMREREGERYDAYRRSAPFLFPLPAVVERAFAAPFRWLFGKPRTERTREVVAVVALYTAALMGVSWLMYGGGLERTVAAVRGSDYALSTMDGLAAAIRAEPDWRRQDRLAERLRTHGEASVDHFIAMLGDEDDAIRELAAVQLAYLPAPQAAGALVAVLDDPFPDVRWHAVEALAANPCAEVVAPLARRLDDPESHIRTATLHALAAHGAEAAVVQAAQRILATEERWPRVQALQALGTLGTEAGVAPAVAALEDPYPWARREAAVTLLRIGSPQAIPALERAARDEDWETRVYAAEAVRRIRRAAPAPGPLSRSRPGSRSRS